MFTNVEGNSILNVDYSTQLTNSISVTVFSSVSFVQFPKGFLPVAYLVVEAELSILGIVLLLFIYVTVWLFSFFIIGKGVRESNISSLHGVEDDILSTSLTFT